MIVHYKHAFSLFVLDAKDARKDFMAYFWYTVY